MAYETELVKLVLESYSLLGEILRQYILPKEISQVAEFTTRNIEQLSHSKAVKHRIEPQPYLSKDTLGNLILKLIWTALCISRIYNDYYLKGHKRRDFIKEAIEYDKMRKAEDIHDYQDT